MTPYKANRLTSIPQPRTLEELAEECERHAKKYRANVWDCADCQDCSDAEIQQFQMNVAEWTEFAQDIRDLISILYPAQAKSLTLGPEFRQCQKCGEAVHRHPYRNCDEAE